LSLTAGLAVPPPARRPTGRRNLSNAAGREGLRLWRWPSGSETEPARSRRGGATHPLPP